MTEASQLDHGRQGDFLWLWSAIGEVTILLEACPDVVRGRPVMVTDYESAPPALKPEEKAQGWRDLHGFAFHHALPETGNLIWSDLCEVYVFKNDSGPEAPPPVFNDGRLTLRDPEDAFPHQETWDRRIISTDREALRKQQRAFWETMHGLEVESYLGVGQTRDFNFVTCRQEHFGKMLEALRALQTS